MPRIFPSEPSSAAVPTQFNRSCIPAFVLRAGILGVFVFALVVAVGSFALFGCRCTQPYVDPEVLADKSMENRIHSLAEPTPSEVKP